MGLEIELNLVDDAMRPAMANSEVLEKIDDPSFTLELGQQNLEINVPPRALAGDETLGLEEELRQSLDDADAKAKDAGANLAMIGMLPTLRESTSTAVAVRRRRGTHVLNDSIFAARGEEMVLRMEGPAMPGSSPENGCDTYAESILPEAACTSVQLHLQVAPDALRRALERRPVPGGRAGRDRRELAVPAGQGALARDPDPVVPAGHRHPSGGAEEPGRAAARVVR